MNPTVFIIDDDPDQVALVTAQIERTRRFATKSFSRAEAALEALLSDPPDAVVCDLVMPGMDGIEFTRRVREVHKTLPIIIATARGTEGDAERALRAGATDFVAKPIEPRSLITRISRSVEDVPAREILTSAVRAKFDPHGIIGHHPLITEVREFVDNVASVPHVSALLLGESGTGKNMVARAIHAASLAASYRFVEINCAALPANLLEGELFGYEKGSFTDAKQAKKGLVEVADNGTLFLDEIGSMPLELQAKLLTFLEGRSFRRIGSTREMSVNLRVVAATNVDIQAEVARGAFREDLYYRLNVASQVLPPLRAIRSDIPAIADHFLKRASEYFAKPLPAIDAAGMERLQKYDWPGNARELRNIIERSMIFSKGPVVRIAELQSAAAPPPADGLHVPRGLTLDEVERLYIDSTLRELGGNVTAAARQLGISRKVLWQRRKRHGLSDEVA
ncbi:MAG TPA: sigma-54 dependent transcriptional regulator [Longimicrobiaceae bacterium]|jgi:DNA-binding NtrC family response regulator|nr:sigma-54 dependent transcriptional regulator [Longimicrobiaceae bacterium]